MSHPKAKVAKPAPATARFRSRARSRPVPGSQRARWDQISAPIQAPDVFQTTSPRFEKRPGMKCWVSSMDPETSNPAPSARRSGQSRSLRSSPRGTKSNTLRMASAAPRSPHTRQAESCGTFGSRRSVGCGVRVSTATHKSHITVSTVRTMRRGSAGSVKGTPGDNEAPSVDGMTRGANRRVSVNVSETRPQHAHPYPVVKLASHPWAGEVTHLGSVGWGADPFHGKAGRIGLSLPILALLPFTPLSPCSDHPNGALPSPLSGSGGSPCSPAGTTSPPRCTRLLLPQRGSTARGRGGRRVSPHAPAGLRGRRALDRRHVRRRPRGGAR